ncbi:MAG TPA: metalloregulator ArsR/SmtB family transcription factor [Hyphomicrobium sp.]|nr:metalloregulator ArsR/SmtB family transcription factor [Hyphomicrobium sp.]
MVEHEDRLGCIFFALSNDTRRKMVRLLARRPYRITELAPKFDISLAAVSKHMQLLERAGLIDRQVRGRDHYCTLKPTALSKAHAWLGGYEQYWSARLDALERVLSEDE